MVHEILTSEQMAAADRFTIAQGTEGFVLMRRAGEGAALIIRKLYAPQKTLVLCGPGNNGGDGYVIARCLKDAGFDVTVWSPVEPSTLTGDAQRAFAEWAGDTHSAFKDQTLVIDALFGTGFNKKLEEPALSILNKIKKSKFSVVAVDIPSGVHGSTGGADPAALRAVHTITFARKKLGHCLMPGKDFCGEVHVVEIGILQEAIEKSGFSACENVPSLWSAAFPHKKAGEHKYTHGHVVISGAEKMTGATRLAAEACARIGAGLTTVIAPEGTGEIYRRNLAPHVIVEDRKNGIVAHLSDARRNAVLIGPGAGRENVEELQKDVLTTLEIKKIVVLDADAITVFENSREKFYITLNKKCILTPHDGEFARLFPDLTGLKTERAQAAAERTGAVIVLKGPDTVIAAPGRKPVINTNAPPWLATAGSGDVLAGMITGLAAQGMEPFDAACAAVWIHGEAARLFGEGLVAADISTRIPEILVSLNRLPG